MNGAAMGELQFHFFFVTGIPARGINCIFSGDCLKTALSTRRKRVYLLAGLYLNMDICHCVGMIATSQQANFIWAVIRMAMVFATPVCWLAFALQFSDRSGWLNKPNIILLSIVPLISLILMATTWRHHLFLTGIDYIQVGPYLIDQTWHLGPWFWVHLVYSYALILVGDFFLLKEALQIARLYRRQAIALLIGTLFPLVTNITYTFHMLPGLVVNYDPFGFVLAGVAFSFGLFQYRLFDLKPVARQVLIDSMGDGMLVVDEQARIIDLNPAALKIFDVSADSFIGHSIIDEFSPYTDVIEVLAGLDETRCEISIEREGRTRVYDLRCTPIIRNNAKMGRLCVLRDITTRKQLESELQDMALTDSLTSLKNRRQFYPLAQQEFERASRYHSPFSLVDD